jgi:MFS family permease
MVSLLGSWMQTTALMQLTFNLTQSAEWTARISVAAILPTLFLGVWGGLLADRLSRRGVVFVCQAMLLGQATLLATLAAGLLGPPSSWALLGLALAGGLVNALDLPARMAFVIDLVGRDDLVNAVALNSVLFNLARAVGPALAGALLLLGDLGPSLCFLLNALSYVAVLLALAAMDPIPMHPVSRPHAERSLWAGLRYLLQRPPLALLLLLAGAMAACGWPTLSLLPALSARTLDAGQTGASYMLSALGAGALLAGLLVASFATQERRGRILGVGVTLAAAGMAGLASAQSLPTAMACCFVVGCGLILFFATAQAVMQLGAGDHNRGLVLGIWSMVLCGAMPLGNEIAGQCADIWGEPAVLRVQALAAALAGALTAAALAVWRGMSRLRRVEE